MTTFEPLTTQDVLDGLKKAIDKRGDKFTFPEAWKEHDACTYFQPEGGEPACIIGEVLADHGLTAGDLGEYRNVKPISSVNIFGGFFADREAQLVAATAQNAQDLGKTWGEAYKAAYAAACRTAPDS